MDLNHANALVTGGSDGYGRGIAKVLRDAGANVWITGRNAAKLSKTAAELGVRAIQADVSSGSDWDRVINKTGDLDILINNAGGALKMPKGEFCDMPLDYWDSQIALNLSGAAYLSHEAIKNMKEHNIPGRIVNISSIHGSVTWVKRKALPYCAGKGGIEMFTKTLAIEVAKYGIRVNCVAPGLILTGVMSRYSDRDVEGFRRKIAAGYLATPEDIVPMIQFFADVEKTKYIVGQTMADRASTARSTVCSKMNFEINQ